MEEEEEAEEEEAEGGGINKQNRSCGLPAIAASTTKYLCIPAWHAVLSEEQHCAALTFVAKDDNSVALYADKEGQFR